MSKPRSTTRMRKRTRQITKVTVSPVQTRIWRSYHHMRPGADSQWLDLLTKCPKRVPHEMNTDIDSSTGISVVMKRWM
jgi:hypothetical protein